MFGRFCTKSPIMRLFPLSLERPDLITILKNLLPDIFLEHGFQLVMLN